jgi:hypothetical protein
VKYKDKASKFKEMTYKAQGLFWVEDKWVPAECLVDGVPAGINKGPRWKDKKELNLYLGEFGGRIKEDKRRRKGYLVSVLQKGLVAEVPIDFAEKVLAFGFP